MLPALIGAGASILGGIMGNRSANKRQERSIENSLEQNKELLTLGNSQDMANQKEMFDYRINQGIEKGMTPYEMFMGPAAGGGGGTTGSGQMLGNNATAMEAQAMKTDMAFKQQTAAQMGELAKTAMQVEGQKEVAQIQNEGSANVADINTESQQYIASINQQIQQGQLDLNKQTLETVTLPQAAQQLKLTEQQTLKAINDVATSDKQFILMMKRLSMGPDNVLMEFAQNYLGVDATNREQVSKLSPEKKQQFVSLVASMKSNLFSEISGLTQTPLLQGPGNWLGNTAGQAVDWLKNSTGTNNPTGETLGQGGKKVRKGRIGAN